MKRILVLLAVVALLSSCGGSSVPGELIGVQGRQEWQQADPYGMVYIPKGSYVMGVTDQDVANTMNTQPKTVTVQAFWMDETEITNNEYRQFVYWVRDSLFRRAIAQSAYPEAKEFVQPVVDNSGADITDPTINDVYSQTIPFLNWEQEIDFENVEVKNALEKFWVPDAERYYRIKELDVRKLVYDYFWVDLKAAAQRVNREVVIEGQGNNIKVPLFSKNRQKFIKKSRVLVYPDTLAWIHDFTYSFNDPMTENYFWHPSYDNFPVVGVNWHQAKAFCVWRTTLYNSWLQGNGDAWVNRFRLPTESEWEWGARGNLDMNPYPWGGPYERSDDGCFLANFKPLRGNYTDDGGATTVIVGMYYANDFGLYDMAGNVSEWTNNAFDESAYSFTHDLNMDYTYDAEQDDPIVLKRKVIRGGSWKDFGFFLQVGSRSYEYQDTSKCYIGFRCVQSYTGTNLGGNVSNVY